MTVREKPHVHILIACMPKSGSSFLSDIITEIGDFQRAIPIPSGLRREQELDEFYLQQVDHLDYVAQLHIRYSEWTREMCDDYNLKPVVLIRSLFDIVVSLRDHLRRESHIWPMIWVEPHHTRFDDATLERMIARLAVPWYVQFYMSWRDAPDAMIVSYEELVADKAAITKKILSFAGVSVSDEQIAKAVTFVDGAGASRLNSGIAGRGNALGHDVVRSILELLDFYPEAASDPYFQQIRQQGQAILAGEAVAPGLTSSKPRPLKTVLPEKHPWRRRLRRYGIRFLMPALLVVLAAAYWLLPDDLIPDNRPWGHLDDAVILAILAFAAGRLTKYKVAIENLRLRPHRKTVEKMLQRARRGRAT